MNKALFSFFVFVLLSCRPDREVRNYSGEYELQGLVWEDISGKPIAKATVSVLQKDPDQMAYFPKTVATTLTDDNGRYSLKFSANTEDFSYELSARSFNCFDKIPGDAIKFVKSGKGIQDIHLLPHAYLTLHLIGDSTGDKISINYNVGGPFYHNADTLVTARIRPDLFLALTYWVLNQKSEVLYKNSIDLPVPAPHDTTYYSVRF